MCGYHFGYGSESVPKIKPLQTISIEASVLLGKKCIQTIKASGRIPREDAVSGYIRLLCRCGYVKEDRLKSWRWNLMKNLYAMVSVSPVNQPV